MRRIYAATAAGVAGTDGGLSVLAVLAVMVVFGGPIGVALAKDSLVGGLVAGFGPEWELPSTVACMILLAPVLDD
jgi:hypothetical protein